MRKNALTCAVSAGALAAVLAATPAWAQAQANAVPATAQEDAHTASQRPPAPSGEEQAAQNEEIIVTGFRGSLAQAVTLKRESIAFRDSIVAEDIGKFPEANVADSMQRIPGVILSRDGGAGTNEGQRVEIRGLSADFVVTTLNGAPVRTTSAGSVGSSSRAFNYDVFPSELFGRVDVYKSPLANLEEGGIGGNVDLQTPRPFDNKGRVIRYNAQYNYNTQSKAWRPRGSLLLSDTWGNFGALLGVAYAQTVNERSGFQATSGHNSSALGRRPYYATPTNPVPPNTFGYYQFELDLDNPRANLGNLTRAQVENAQLPRFYRVYSSNTERERLGFVGSLQYKSDRFEASVDGIYSRLTDRMDEFTFGAPVRSTRTAPGTTDIPGRGTNSGIIPLDVRIDKYNNLYGRFGNTSIITESFFRDFKTEYKYAIARAVYDVSDSLKLSAQAAISDSDAWQSGNRIVSNIYGIETTYDPTVNITYPTISSPVDFTNTSLFRDPSLGFALQKERDRVKSFRGALDYTVVDTGDTSIAFKLGGSYVSSIKERSSQDGSAIARTLPLPNGGTVASTPANVFTYMDRFLQYGQLANGGNSGYPSNFATFSRSFVMNTLAANDANSKAPRQLNASYDAEERVKSAFFETSFKLPIGGHELRGNAGIRYSDTKTIIDNFASVGGTFTPNNRKGGYENYLPSASLAFDVTRKLLLRGSMGQTVTRGALNDIAGSIVVPNVFNNAVTVGNPDLRPQIATTYDAAVEWYFAPGALLSVGVFKKDIKDRPTAITEDVPFAQAGLDASFFSCAAFGGATGTCTIEQINALTNGNPFVRRTIVQNLAKLELKGLELAYQQNFTFLPAPFDGLGITSSFTVIDQNQAGNNSFNFVLTNGDVISLQSVPDYTYSITGFYEKGPFALRGSYNYRAKTGSAQTNNGSDKINYFAPQGYLDATVSYKINEMIELRVDALNITNQNVFNYFENPQQPNNRTHRDNSFYNGRTIAFGIRGKF
ncbi:TonB-dependent receptor [Sphingomonas sp.]|uniref:TonB-dependent receptor n=1 Tax=Sphingomonas sp. TaxID=28214 RepID=UPI002FDA5DDA